MHASMMLVCSVQLMYELEWRRLTHQAIGLRLNLSSCLTLL